MNKRTLDLLERVYAAEIDGALNGGLGLHETRSKLARALVAEGLLIERQLMLPGRFPVIVRCYALTEFGRLTYCTSERAETP